MENNNYNRNIDIDNNIKNIDNNIKTLNKCIVFLKKLEAELKGIKDEKEYVSLFQEKIIEYEDFDKVGEMLKDKTSKTNGKNKQIEIQINSKDTIKELFFKRYNRDCMMKIATLEDEKQKNQESSQIDTSKRMFEKANSLKIPKTPEPFKTNNFEDSIILIDNSKINNLYEGIDEIPFFIITNSTIEDDSLKMTKENFEKLKNMITKAKEKALNFNTNILIKYINEIEEKSTEAEDYVNIEIFRSSLSNYSNLKNIKFIKPDDINETEKLKNQLELINKEIRKREKKLKQKNSNEEYGSCSKNDKQLKIEGGEIEGGEIEGGEIKPNFDKIWSDLENLIEMREKIKRQQNFIEMCEKIENNFDNLDDLGNFIRIFRKIKNDFDGLDNFIRIFREIENQNEFYDFIRILREIEEKRLEWDNVQWDNQLKLEKSNYNKNTTEEYSWHVKNLDLFEKNRTKATKGKVNKVNNFNQRGL